LCNFRGWGTFTGRFSRVLRLNFTKLGEDIRRSSLLIKFILEFRYIAASSNAGGSKLSDVENDANFRGGWGWARSLDQLVKLYLGPNLRNTSDGHLLRG